MSSIRESSPDTANADYIEARLTAAELREKLKLKLVAEDRADLEVRLAKCGRAIRLYCGGCGDFRDVLTRCDLKWCPSCQQALAARTAERYAKIMAAIKWPLRVTLTAKNFDYDDCDAVRKLRRAWSRFRRLRWFRHRVVGGVLGIECTDRGKGFHVHAHAIFDCRWLAVDECAPRVGASKAEWKRRGRAAAAEVGEQWSLCTKRPASVQVRRLWTRDGDLGDALRETLKYSVKGSDLAEGKMPAGRLIDQLDKCRLVTSFGSCFGRPEFKRVRGAPQMCQCGCTQWIPSDALPTPRHFPPRF